jgi:hypothetical protein
MDGIYKERRALIDIPSLIKIGSGIQKLSGGGEGVHIQTHRQQSDIISLLSVLQNKESRLRMNDT